MSDEDTVVTNDPVVAIVRNGQVACRNCIRDTTEDSIWNNDIDADDLIRELKIKLVKASEAKATDTCGRCGRKIVGS
jgi:hypothetical protein